MAEEPENDIARQRDEFFQQLESESAKLPVTGVAPDLNPDPQHWNEAVDLFNKINKIR